MDFLAVGVFLILSGFSLAGFTGNLFRPSKFEEMTGKDALRKKENSKVNNEDAENVIFYFKINRYIFILSRIIVVFGVVLSFIAFFS